MGDFLTNMYIQNVQIFMSTGTPYVIEPGPGVDINKLPKDITDYVYQSKIKFGHISNSSDSISHIIPVVQHPTLNQVKENLHKKRAVDNIISHAENGYIIPGPSKAVAFSALLHDLYKEVRNIPDNSAKYDNKPAPAPAPAPVHTNNIQLGGLADIFNLNRGDFSGGFTYGRGV